MVRSNATTNSPPIGLVAAVEELDPRTIERACRNEQAAWKQLVETYGPRVYAFVARMHVRDPSSVDDISQEVFLRVSRALPKFDVRGPARLSTWILKIATRVSIDHFRRSKHASVAAVEGSDARLDDDFERRSSDDPEAAFRAAQLGAKLEAAIGALPPDQRAVLVLRAYHDLDYIEIAEASVDPAR